MIFLNHRERTRSFSLAELCFHPAACEIGEKFMKLVLVMRVELVRHRAGDILNKGSFAITSAGLQMLVT
jgi:hypothetical protein